MEHLYEYLEDPYIGQLYEEGMIDEDDLAELDESLGIIEEWSELINESESYEDLRGNEKKYGGIAKDFGLRTGRTNKDLWSGKSRDSENKALGGVPAGERPPKSVHSLYKNRK